MYDEFDIVGTFGDDSYVSLVPNYLSDLESESSDFSEDSSEEGLEEISADSVESESELESESEEYGSSEGNDNTVIDYTELLNDIQSNLENIETNQLSIINNLEILETKIDMIENVSFYTFYLFVACFIGAIFLIIYNWFNNFIK